MRRFENYRLGPNDYGTPETFNPIFKDMDDRLHAQEELRPAMEALQRTLVAQAAGRIDDVLLPALEYLQTVQQGGFLTAGINDETSLEFVEGNVAVAIDQTLKAIFRPTPFIAVTRASTHEDWAVAQVLGYDAETGVLSLAIVAVNGDSGPHTDVIFTATSGSLMAQIAYLSGIEAARDEAVEAKNLAVPAASTAVTKAGEAADAASDAESARDKAQDWAEGTLPGGAGTKSAKEHALAAAQSAEDAALFDPSSYYTKGETYSQGEVDGLVDAVAPDLDAIRANIARLEFLRMVEDGLSYQQMADGVADEFEDQSGVDGSASTGERYSASGYFDNRTARGSQTVVPAMSFNTTPAGHIASDSIGSGGAWRAFDGTTAFHNIAATSGWLAYEGPAANTLAGYAVTAENPSPSPKDWTFEGWNGSTWDVLDTVTGQTGWPTGARRVFTLDAPATYTKFRLNFSANNGHTQTYIRELELLPAVPLAATLISETFEAVTQPDTAYLLILHEAVDPAVLNTDIIASVSRDDGVTWTAGTLAKVGEIGGYDLLSETIDVSGQPAGTDMRWKIELTDDAEQRIHAVSLQWS